MNKFNHAIISSAVFLAACGGGGSSNPVGPTAATGVFVDSPVAGLAYSAGTKSGTTGADGSYTCDVGQPVKFSLGSLQLPAVTCTTGAAVVTPLTIFGTTDVNDLRVVNLARLLQTLDQNGNADDGINIAPEVAQNTANLPATLDFASVAFDTDVSAFLTNLSNAGLIPSATLVSAANASAHLQNQSSSLVGSWSVSDSAGDSILTFLPNGEYVHTQIGASDAIGHTGMERGNYTWNKDTGAFVTPCPTVDTNGELGLSHGTSGICSGTNGTVTMSGNTLTLGFAGNLKLARVIDAINPIVGSWSILDSTGESVITFFANGNYVHAQNGTSDATGQTGVERGAYTWNPVTGAFASTCPAVDTNGEWGLSHGTPSVCSGTQGTVTVNGNVLSLGFDINYELLRVVPTAQFAPTTYTIYKTGQQAALSGAGAISSPTASGGTLSLGADGNTALAVAGTTDFAMTATNRNFYTVNRRSGAVLMLCDPLAVADKPGFTHAQYVAIATHSATPDTQGVLVTSAAELAGKSFHEIDECSYVKDDGIFTPEQQNRAPSGATLEHRFDASGNLRSSDGLFVDAATFTGHLNGTPFVDGKGRNIWFSAYKFTVGSEQKIYFAIRIEPFGGDQGYVVAWTDDPSSDVLGCSLNCAKPADAVPVTTPATVPGVYVTQFGFGEEAYVVWIDSSGNYSYGVALASSADRNAFRTGIEFGALSFDGIGNATATILPGNDTNGTGESLRWSANATKIVATAVADLNRHVILERVTKDPANPHVGAWVLESCNGTVVGSPAVDPRSRILFVHLKSGHYVMLDPLAGPALSPIGIEYGTYIFNKTTGKDRVTGVLYDTNNEDGNWNSVMNQPNTSDLTLTFTDNGDTLSLSAAGDICGNATLTRIN